VTKDWQSHEIREGNGMQHARHNMPSAALACAAMRMPRDDIEEHDDIEELQAKRHQPMQLQLPFPLTEQLLSQAMRELNQGTARAVESCLQCYYGKRMSGDDLLSFTHSIDAAGRAERDERGRGRQRLGRADSARGSPRAGTSVLSCHLPRTRACSSFDARGQPHANLL